MINLDGLWTSILELNDFCSLWNGKGGVLNAYSRYSSSWKVSKGMQSKAPFTRNRIRSYPVNSMRIGLAFTPSLPYRDNLPFSIRRMFIRLRKSRTNISGEQFSKPRHVWTACPGRMGKDKCEYKAYPHKVCPDRNRIWLRVNKIGSLSKYLWMLFLSDETFFG